MYVCSQNTAKMVHDSAKFLGSPYSPFSCGVQYHVSFKSGNEKNYLKNQFPIQSSPLRENLINANNLSGIVRWSYLFIFFLKLFILKSQTFRIQKERFIFKHKINRHFDRILPCSFINKIVFRRLCTIICSTFFYLLFFSHWRAISSFVQIRQRKKLLKKSIPDSVKYSSGVFDQWKQPQRYSSLELFLFYFILKCFFFVNCCHNGNPMGSRVI